MMLYFNEIVDEIHKIREEYSELFNHDLDAIFADLYRQQAESKRQIVRLIPKQSLTKRWSGKVMKADEEKELSARRSD
jgi:hypothetical protein